MMSPPSNNNTNNNSNLNFSIIDFQTQLWNLVNLHRQMPKIENLMEKSGEGTVAASSPPPRFSIENILGSLKMETNGLKSTEEEELAELEEESSSTPSPASSQKTSFSLDSLNLLDHRRTNNRKSSSSSSNRCVCDACGKSYATTSNLSRHKQTHRALDSPHAKQCPHCDRVYVSMPALSMHILTHNASHECNVCGKRFSRLWLLQGHLRSHSGLRPFSCAHCGKSFADRSNLRAHMLTHTGDKRFGCDKCGRKFALRAYLNRHFETCK